MINRAEVQRLKEDMCEIGRRIWQRGFCAGNEGNHSVRISEDRFLCTPTGISKGFLDPEDICVVDASGEQCEANRRGRKRTSEVLVHLAIYKKRPDVGAVIHSHPAHAVAFCLAGMPLPEGIHPEAEVFLGKVPIAAYATPGTPALSESILPLIGPETNTILMGNHGSVSCGDDLTQAYYRLEILDNYCRQLILARQLGQVNQLNNQQIQELLKVKESFGFPDSRLQCAAQGCVGAENQPFLAAFEVNPASAQCDCNGHVAQRQPVPAQSQAQPREQPSGNGQGGEDFDRLVQAITDQIMASMK
ncbi:MAG: class II aldolase/adducin family protein [Phycisphaeraceae bacterium]